MNFQKLNLTDLKLIINNAETKETNKSKLTVNQIMVNKVQCK